MNRPPIRAPIANGIHVPVLLGEVLEVFESAPDGALILDGTLGGTGHAGALLARLPSARLLACDVDDNAIQKGRERLATLMEAGRCALERMSFAEAVEASPDQLPPGFGPPWWGALLDLGYSSEQMDSPEYGMSFLREAPLDMRLSREGPRAWDILSGTTDEELAGILAAYGEIPGARSLSRHLHEALRLGDLTDSTLSLARLMERARTRSRRGSHPATLVFQALRIAVNDELRALDQFLEGAILNRKVSGRIAVISFHSLEDRIVKAWGRKHAVGLRALTRKPVVPGEREARDNPRARSAKLRAYEVLSPPSARSPGSRS